MTAGAAPLDKISAFTIFSEAPRELQVLFGLTLLAFLLPAVLRNRLGLQIRLYGALRFGAPLVGLFCAGFTAFDVATAAVNTLPAPLPSGVLAHTTAECAFYLTLGAFGGVVATVLHFVHQAPSQKVGDDR